MRTDKATMTILCGLLLAGLLWARPEVPKQEPAVAAPAAGAGKAAETGPAAVADKHSAEHLRGRVEQFWKSKIAAKYDECYNLLTKKSKDKQTLVNYIQRINTRTTGYQIESVTPDPANPDHVKVMVSYKLQALGYKMDNTRQSQNWYFEDGDWFLEYFVKNPFDSKSRKSTTEKAADSAQTTPAGAAGKTEKSGMDPEQKKHFQELMEQLRKSHPATKPSLNEALAPQEKTGQAAAAPPAAPEKKAAAEGTAAPADTDKKAAPEKKATDYQTKPHRHASKGAKSATPPAKQEPAQAVPPAETPVKQDPAKAGTPAETPAKQDPAKTGGDPKK